MPQRISKHIQELILKVFLKMPYTSKDMTHMEYEIENYLCAREDVLFSTLGNESDILHYIALEVPGVGKFTKELWESDKPPFIYGCYFRPNVEQEDFDYGSRIDTGTAYMVDNLRIEEANDVCRAFIPYLLSKGKNTDNMLLAVNLFTKAVRCVLSGSNDHTSETGEHHARRTKIY